MVVDLPAPFGPTKPVICPGATVKDNWSSATVWPNLLHSPVTSMVASMPGRLGNAAGPGRHAVEPCSPPLARGTGAAASPTRGIRHWRAGGTPAPRPAATMTRWMRWVTGTAPWPAGGGGSPRPRWRLPSARARSPRGGRDARPDNEHRSPLGADRARPGGGGRGYHGAPGPAMGPAPAAPAVTAAAVVSLAAFHMLTAAGLAAQLAALYRLGRHGPAVLAAATAMPYLAVALGPSAAWRRRGLPHPAGLDPPRWPPGPVSPGGRAARPSRTAPPGRSSPAACSSTRRAVSGRASPGNCTTSWPTTSP